MEHKPNGLKPQVTKVSFFVLIKVATVETTTANSSIKTRQWSLARQSKSTPPDSTATN